MQNKMFLTVIIRCFNRDEIIRECLESAISQTFIDKMQILIIDDGSTDNSLSIIQTIKNDNPNICIDIIQHDKNKGRGKALNTAKQYIKGKYCCILDSDYIYTRTTWVEELYNSIGDKTFDCLYSGNKDDFHVNHIYLSKLFKKAPIANFNYYEDHYTRWFLFRDRNICVYPIRPFYKYRYNHQTKDRLLNEHINSQKINYSLYLLYENVFYYRFERNIQINDIIASFKDFDCSELDEILMETYLEIKQELKL